MGTINFHPAYLPNYKGVSPIFWSLVNKDRYSGVTIHYIDEGVDTGKIIVRKKINIEKEDTEDSLYWKSVVLGSQMLIKTIEDIKSGKLKTLTNKKGNYYSFPTKESVKKFKKNGRGFFRLSEYLFGCR